MKLLRLALLDVGLICLSACVTDRPHTAVNVPYAGPSTINTAKSLPGSHPAFLDISYAMLLRSTDGSNESAGLPETPTQQRGIILSAQPLSCGTIQAKIAAKVSPMQNANIVYLQLLAPADLIQDNYPTYPDRSERPDGNTSSIFWQNCGNTNSLLFREEPMPGRAPNLVTLSEVAGDPPQARGQVSAVFSGERNINAAFYVSACDIPAKALAALTMICP